MLGTDSERNESPLPGWADVASPAAQITEWECTGGSERVYMFQGGWGQSQVHWCKLC